MNVCPWLVKSSLTEQHVLHGINEAKWLVSVTMEENWDWDLNVWKSSVWDEESWGMGGKEGYKNPHSTIKTKCSNLVWRKEATGEGSC